MEATINYLLQSGLCLLVLYGFYMLVLRSFPKPDYNRLFLLLAPVAALLIPVLEIPMLLPSDYAAPAIQAMQLPEVTITGYAQQTEKVATITAGFIVTIVYSLAAFALLVRLGLQLFRLQKMVTSATPVGSYSSEATVLQINSDHPTFAFLNYIFVNPQRHLTEHEEQQVLAHELAHVRLRHTYDVLFYEVLTAILWFNPLVWLLKAELRDVHEYQADAEVVATYQPEVYTSLLAKEALYTTGIMVGSHFYKPQVFKRLHMLQKRGQKVSLLRQLLVLPLLLAMLFFFSTSGEVTADMATTLTPVPELQPTIAEQTIQPESEKETIVAVPEKVPVVVTAKAADEPSIRSSKPEPIATIKTEEPAPAQRPYSFVEQMPEFKGGEMEMSKFIARNLRYPKATQEAGIAGMVVASFIVQPDGKLTDITILKGIDEAADQEAIRVVEKMNGQWSPGSQNGNMVPVRFTIPIRFVLTN